MSVVTDRLIMRPMKESDAEQVVYWRNQRRIKTVLESEADEPLTVHAHLEWFRSTRDTRYDYMVCLKERQEPIGVWSFKPASYRDAAKCMEQGRYIGDSNQLGKGYALEASKAWTFFGFERLSLEAIVSIHRLNNEAPQKINLKVGFAYYDAEDAKSAEFRRMVMTRTMFEQIPTAFWGAVDIRDE